MLQWLYTYVTKVCYPCFICVFWTHVASVFIWMLHMFHIYVACVLSGCCVWLQWFSSVFRCFFKCFNCLQMYVATVVSRCFKSKSSIASLLLAFYCIVSVCPLPVTDRASIRRRGRVLLNWRRRPLCRSAALALRRAHETECGAWSTADSNSKIHRCSLILNISVIEVLNS
jgi:hypothetical protein